MSWEVQDSTQYKEQAMTKRSKKESDKLHRQMLEMSGLLPRDELRKVRNYLCTGTWSIIPSRVESYFNMRDDESDLCREPYPGADKFIRGLLETYKKVYSPTGPCHHCGLEVAAEDQRPCSHGRCCEDCTHRGEIEPQPRRGIFTRFNPPPRPRNHDEDVAAGLA